MSKMTHCLCKTLTSFSLCVSLLLLGLPTSFGAERWQIVILADKTSELPSEFSLYPDINHSITQGLTLILSAADFDIHSVQELGLTDCKLNNCVSIDPQNLRQAVQRAGKTINLALRYQFKAFKLRQNNEAIWQFSLAGRVLDLASGMQLDAFEVTKRVDDIKQNCIAECKNAWLNQTLHFLSQELGAVLSEKLQALPRRQHYDVQLLNFTQQELQHTADYLQALDTHVASTLVREYAPQQQWLHHIASRDYQYISELSSAELGSMLAHFLDEQGMQVEITYEQSQGLFVLSRSGMPYLNRYIAFTVIFLLMVFYLFYRKKPQQSEPTQGRNSSLLWLVVLCLILMAGIYWRFYDDFNGAVSPDSNNHQPESESELEPEQTPEQKQVAEQVLKQQQDDNDWQQASKINTLQSYQIYLNRWPDGQYLIQASAALKVKIDDETAWQTAIKLATVEAYQDYLDQQPAGDFRQRALQKLTLLFKDSQQTQKLTELLKLAEDNYYQQKNYREARYYYEQAAQMNDALAQYQLGQIYALAQGIKQDQRLATKWYQQAAEQGHAQAQFELAYRYSKALGIKQDNAQALYWYQQAAEQGVSLAQYNLAYLYAQGHVTRRDYQQAAYWYQKAAEQGDADAQNNLGKLYENGQGVSQDLTKAKILYRQATAQGHQVAKINLSLLNN
ncbi:tetratricopeptide repeat protein [Paraglaciecola hydrolytica]|nr:tetratricopeptide repeat protein [Paraglaciecola hydrolytica]